MLKKAYSLKSNSTLKREGIDRLKTTLRVAGLRFRDRQSQAADLVLELEDSASSDMLVAEVKSRLWPSEVHSAAQQLRVACLEAKTGGCAPVVVAPSISSRTAELCRAEGLNWADFAGNCHVQSGSFLIHILGNSNPLIKKRGTGSLFSPRSSRIVHLMLLDPHHTWKVQELADQSKVSLGQASNVRKLLLRERYAEVVEDGLRITDAKRLLENWALGYKGPQGPHRFYSLTHPSELEEIVSQQIPLSDFAFTEFSSAERYAPYTRHRSVSLYVPDWQVHFAKRLDLRPGDDTSNVTVYTDEDGLNWSESQRGLPCASPIRTYLDLTALGGRGQESAEHLFDTVIAKRWRE